MTSTSDLAQAYVQQQGDTRAGFWNKSGGLRQAVARWVDDLEQEAIQRGVDGDVYQAHGLVDAIRAADLDELTFRVEVLLDPDSLKDADPTTLPDELYGQYRQQMMPQHPGGERVGLFDDIRDAAVTTRRYAGSGGLYGNTGR